jgi:hypothetical protein
MRRTPPQNLQPVGNLDLGAEGFIAPNRSLKVRPSASLERGAISTSGETAFSDTNLTPATSYFYRVIATNTAGDSAPSPVVSVTTFQTSPRHLPGHLHSAAQWRKNHARDPAVRTKVKSLAIRNRDGSIYKNQIHPTPPFQETIHWASPRDHPPAGPDLPSSRRR